MTWRKASSSWRVFGCQEGVKESSFFLFQFRCQRRCQKIIIIIIIIIIITGAQWSHNHWCLRRHSRQGTIIKQSSNSWLKACSPRISHSWNSLSKQIFAQKMQQKMKEEKNWTNKHFSSRAGTPQAAGKTVATHENCQDTQWHTKADDRVRKNQLKKLRKKHRKETTILAN